MICQEKNITNQKMDHEATRRDRPAKKRDFNNKAIRGIRKWKMNGKL